VFNANVSGKSGKSQLACRTSRIVTDVWLQATSSHNEAAKKCVRFHGHVYSHESLETIEEVAESDGPVSNLRCV
jgi:hypothetical protein